MKIKKNIKLIKKIIIFFYFITSMGCVILVAIDPAIDPIKNLQKESNFFFFKGFLFAS